MPLPELVAGLRPTVRPRPLPELKVLVPLCPTAVPVMPDLDQSTTSHTAGKVVWFLAGGLVPVGADATVVESLPHCVVHVLLGVGAALPPPPPTEA